MVNQATAQQAHSTSNGTSTDRANRPGAATATKIGTLAAKVAPATTPRTAPRGDDAYQIATPTSAMTNDGCSAL